MIAACGQMEATTIDEAKQVWAVVDRLAAEAKDERADLFVLPEATYPAYWLESADRYMQLDIERTDIVLERYSQLAKKHGFWLIAGCIEEAGGTLFNSAAIFDRKGERVGIVRKNFLWDCDHNWFTAGHCLETFDSEFGRLGVLICADARVPEIVATLAHDGAELIVQPTAWVNTTTIRRTYRNIQPDFLIQARAMEFGVPFVCCSKAGREGTVLEYVGQSRIVPANGKVSSSAPVGGEQLVVSEVEPGSPKQTEIDGESLERIMSSEAPYQPTKPGDKIQLSLGTSVDNIASSLESTGVRIARLAMADMNVFWPARRYALEGSQVLLVRGRFVDDKMIRTRAAENRVFVIVATEKAQTVIAPDGGVIWRQVDWNDTIELDMAQADIKQFTTSTNIWAQRQVETYRLGSRA